MINFDFLEKGLSIASPPHFLCFIFQEKCFSCYILLSEEIYLSNCLYFFRYWVICVLQLFIFRIVTSTKKSRQKSKCLVEKQQTFFIIFKELSVAKNCLRPESAPLNPFYRCYFIYYFGRYLSQLAELVPIPHSRGRSTSYFNSLHDFSVSVPRCYIGFFGSSFFPCTARLLNFLPAKCFFFRNFMPFSSCSALRRVIPN